MTTTTITAPLRDLYQSAREKQASPLPLTPHEQAALDSANKAFYAASRQADEARKSRGKGKEARISEANALFDAARETLARAKAPEELAERDRNFAITLIMEQVAARLAMDTFGDVEEARDFHYVNSVPTDEQRPSSYRYGEMETVWKTTVDIAPIPGYVRAFESGDIRITMRGNRTTDLTFEVQLLADEEAEYAPGLRKERFGLAPTVRHVNGSYRTRDEVETVEVSLAGGNNRDLKDAEDYLRVLTVTVNLARKVEALIEAVSAS